MTKAKNHKEYRFLDKKAWGPGPWQDEPDKVQWIDKATDLDCLMVRGPSGSWCGYVGVMDGHPFFEKDYSAYPGPGDMDVHGGVTFTNLCQEDKKEHGVCHVPAAGRSDHVWWIGFDCSHSWDFSPKHDKDVMQFAGEVGKMARHLSDAVDFGDGRFETSYKDLVYVQKEICVLAAQIKEVYDKAVM